MKQGTPSSRSRNAAEASEGGGGYKGKGKKGGPAATPSVRDCANCGAPEGSIPGIKKHSACRRCLITFYCGTQCQKTHWKAGGHKTNCLTPEERRVPAPENDASSRGGAASESLCAICLCPLGESPAKPLQCSHVYHVACVKKLRSFKIKQACPVCRADLSPGLEKLWEEGARRFMVLHFRYGQGFNQPWRRVENSHDRSEVVEMTRMCHEAADQGHTKAQLLFGNMLDMGWGNFKEGQNDTRAEEWYRKSALQGDEEAQLCLGQFYRLGKGLPQDDTLAVHWYRKAAAQGQANAQGELANMYHFGKGGLQRDDIKAASLYRKAADHGYAHAQYNLGMFYTSGMGGLPVNMPLAMAWIRKAADQGLGKAHQGLGKAQAVAEYNIGTMYAGGRGVPQDFSEALLWLRRAEAGGQQMATDQIGAIEQILQSQRRQKAAAAPPPQARSSPPLTAIATTVHLCGLQAKPELNGQRGVVIGFDTSTGRCSVQLEDGRGPFNIKPENLEEAAAATAGVAGDDAKAKKNKTQGNKKGKKKK